MTGLPSLLDLNMYGFASDEFIKIAYSGVIKTGDCRQQKCYRALHVGLET